MFAAIAAVITKQGLDVLLTYGKFIATFYLSPATLPVFNLPVGGMLLIMGIDQFLDMGRTMTNVIGNGLATAAVAKWEGELNLIE